MSYTQAQFTEDKQFVSKYIKLTKQQAIDRTTARTLTAGAIERINQHLKIVAKEKGTRVPYADFIGLMRNADWLEY